MRRLGIGLALGILSLGAGPRAADAHGDINFLLLIGEEHPEDTPADAFDRHLKAGHIRVVTKTLAAIEAKDVPDDQFRPFLEVTRVLRVHALGWTAKGVHEPESIKLTIAVHDLAKALVTSHPKKPDLQAAYGQALVAHAVERLNRKDDVVFAETFDAGVKACLEAVKLDKTRSAEFHLDAALCLRAGVPHAGKAKWDVLDRVAALLEKARGKETAGTRDAEDAWTHLLRARMSLDDRKRKKGARAIVEKGLALVAPDKGEQSDRAAGAYNELVHLAISNRWMPADTKLVTASEALGGLEYAYPRGCGWALGNEKKQLGTGKLLLERARPDGAWIEVGITTFKSDLTYGEGDIPGDNAKALLVMMRENWKSDLSRPKKAKAPKVLPDWAKGVNGFHIMGGTAAGYSMTIFGWTFRGAASDTIYGINVVVEGKLAKKLPAQAALIVASLREAAK